MRMPVKFGSHFTSTTQLAQKNASQRGHLRVEDDGCGIPTCGQAGMGLANMRQRAHAIGGQLQISARAGGGTCLHLSW